MRFRSYIEAHKDELIGDLQSAIRIPSVYQADGSGYPYGRPVQDCLDYILNLAEEMGFSAVNMDNQLGWCEYGEGEEMVAVLGHLDVVPEGEGWSVPPYEGVNANGRLVRFLARLPFEGQLGKAVVFLAEKLSMEYDGASLGIAMADDVSGALTNNFGVLLCDESSVEVRLNYRYPVTKSYDMCAPQVRAAFEAAGFRQTEATHKACLYMPEDSELVRRLMKVYRECTGDGAARPKSIGGGTYAKMLPNVLAFGPIFPGDEVREHKPDEFMEISRLIDNANMLAEAMYALACE